MKYEFLIVEEDYEVTGTNDRGRAEAAANQGLTIIFTKIDHQGDFDDYEEIEETTWEADDGTEEGEEE